MLLLPAAVVLFILMLVCCCCNAATALLILLSLSGLFPPCLPRVHAFSLYISKASDALVADSGVCRSKLTGYGMWSTVALAPNAGHLGIRIAGLSKAAGWPRMVGMRITS